MKKILLATAAMAAITSSAFAVDLGIAGKGLYFKTEAGWTKFPTVKGKNKNTPKLKANNSATFGAGVGYKVMDNVRLELMFNKFTTSESKTKFENEVDDDGKKFSVAKVVRLNASTLMVNGFYDYDLDVAKIFAGAGIGMAHLSGEKGYIIKDNGVRGYSTSQLKSKTNFAWALHLGASTEIAPGITTELAYSYRNLGNAGMKVKGGNGKKLYKGTFGTNNVTFGLRFDI